MDNLKIVLSFEKTITNLSGNPYGRKSYETQAKGKINNQFGEKMCFVFPSNIENIASSFIQGFFEELVEKIGIEGIERNVDISADGIADAKNYVMRKLKY